MQEPIVIIKQKQNCKTSNAYIQLLSAKVSDNYV